MIQSFLSEIEQKNALQVYYFDDVSIRIVCAEEVTSKCKSITVNQLNSELIVFRITLNYHRLKKKQFVIE